MGIIKKSADIAKIFGIDVEKLPVEAKDFLLDRANRMVQEEQADRESFKKALKGFSDADLMVFVPDIYQKDIYHIDYAKLKESGIKLISFDIDDTIGDVFIHNVEARVPGLKVTMSKEARALFQQLKSMGFTVALLTNAQAKIAEDTCDDLNADGYIARAEKPETKNFEAMMKRFGITDPKQMAHVGNSITQDIRGGNQAGVTTCLVRRAGNSMKVWKGIMKLAGIKTKGHQVRKRLLERDLWRKHHKGVKGDQYYQLGELPEYRAKRTFIQGNVAEAAAADLIAKINADKDMTFTLEELQRNISKENERAGAETLRTHLGDKIVFTGLWAGASDERELDEAELADGELSGFVFTIGGYMVRDTVCLYRDDDKVHYSQRVPAGPDEIAQYRKERMNALFAPPESGFREVQVICAKHKGTAENWTFVCLAATSTLWNESIDFIGTVKYAVADPDEQEMLFILNQYTGDSYGVANWYKLSADGTVTKYEEHPYNPESYQESWKDAN